MKLKFYSLDELLAFLHLVRPNDGTEAAIEIQVQRLKAATDLLSTAINQAKGA